MLPCNDTDREHPDASAFPSDCRREVGELAESRLSKIPSLALRDIGCVYNEGVLTLRGRLPTLHLKQIAQAVVADIEGVQTIVNQIQVPAPSRH